VGSNRRPLPCQEVKTDGAYHSVSGNPYIDMAAVKIVDARHVESNGQKNGQLVYSDRIELSADGNTTTETFSDSSASTTPVTGKEVFERVASAPPGSLPFSGSWRLVKAEDLSDNTLTFSFKTEGDSVQMTSPTGQSYTAKLGGTEAPYHGDPGVTTASLKRIGPNTYEETDKLGDKVVGVARMTVSADGKTMSVEVHDLRIDRTSKYVAVKAIAPPTTGILDDWFASRTAHWAENRKAATCEWPPVMRRTSCRLHWGTLSYGRAAAQLSRDQAQ